MSQNDTLNVTTEQLDDIINYVVMCKFNGNCSKEVKKFSDNVTIPANIYNKILANNQRKDDITIPTKSIGSFSLYDGSYNKN
jgi:hypothetical protein